MNTPSDCLRRIDAARFALAAAFTIVTTGCGGGSANLEPRTKGADTLTASKRAQEASGPLSADAVRGLLAAPDRTDADRELDAQRHPDLLLQFFGVGPAMRVADLGAGRGYTTELLARAVGANGKVFSQNDPGLVKRVLDGPIRARLARAGNENVIRVDRPFDDPLPPDARNLDLVVNYIFYHDVVWIGADRGKMNKAVLEALKPGGIYVIVDASAKPGHGVEDAQTLHRIEESVVKDEVERAGFAFVASEDFLRNANDTRDWNSSPRVAGERLGTEDRFVLKFTKR